VAPSGGAVFTYATKAATLENASTVFTCATKAATLENDSTSSNALASIIKYCNVRTKEKCCWKS
jgi:hypothetical protein